MHRNNNMTSMKNRKSIRKGSQIMPMTRALYYLVFTTLLVAFVVRHYNVAADLKLTLKPPSASGETKSKYSGDADDGRTRFLFIMGTEGSGHHFILSLYEHSPVKKYLASVGVRPEETLGPLLYRTHGDEAGGLFSSAVSQNKRIFPNGTSLSAAVADELRLIDAAVRRNASRAGPSSGPSAPDGRWFVPINCVEPDAVGVSGTMSYPNFNRPSRPSQYPDLHALYSACDAAGVACEHVFLHRDPYAVVRSTTMKRVFEIRKHSSAKVYDAMLSVMAVQMMKFPGRLAGCWDFGSPGGWIEDAGRALGWPAGDFRGALPDKTRRKIETIEDPMTEVEKARIIPPPLQVYMDTLMGTYYTVVGLCKRFEEDRFGPR